MKCSAKRFECHVNFRPSEQNRVINCQLDWREETRTRCGTNRSKCSSANSIEISWESIHVFADEDGLEEIRFRQFFLLQQRYLTNDDMSFDDGSFFMHEIVGWWFYITESESEKKISFDQRKEISQARNLFSCSISFLIEQKKNRMTSTERTTPFTLR